MSISVVVSPLECVIKRILTFYIVFKIRIHWKFQCCPYAWFLLNFFKSFFFSFQSRTISKDYTNCPWRFSNTYHTINIPKCLPEHWHDDSPPCQGVLLPPPTSDLPLTLVYLAHRYRCRLSCHIQEYHTSAPLRWLDNKGKVINVSEYPELIIFFL